MTRKKIINGLATALILGQIGTTTAFAVSTQPSEKSDDTTNEEVIDKDKEEEDEKEKEEDEVKEEDSEKPEPPEETPEKPNIDKPVKPTQPTKPDAEKPVETPKKPTQTTSQPKEETKTETEKPTEVATEKEEEATKKTDALAYSTTVQAPIRFSVTKTTQDFINQIGEDARKIGQEQNIYASVMIAQAILESGSGQSSLANDPNNNLFGIKGDYNGQSVTMETAEDNGSGKLYMVQSNFRKYPTYKESLEDYANLINKGLPNNPTFYHGATKEQAKTYQEATQFLTGKYATDTRYDEKLNKLIETYDLTFFDSAIKKGERKIVDHVEVDSFHVVNPLTKQMADFIIPLEQGYTISSPFGLRGAEHHDGIDLAMPENSPIYASSDGVVVETGRDSSAGNFVIIKHDNGLYSNYFHMSKIGAKVGDVVQTGNIIGYVGSTGDSTGNHLHFGLSTQPWESYLNPAHYLEF